jgi:hypothetical protein
MRFIIFLLLIFISTTSFSQEVQVVGKCIDKRGKNIELVEVSGFERVLTTSDSLGRFSFSIQPENDTIQIQFKYFGETLNKRIVLTNKTKIDLGEIRFKFEEVDIVRITTRRGDPFDIPTLPYYDVQKIPMGSVERSLVYTTAATSNNELTSNYNVRGGSYDENLVYINGFSINRPFLTRSGQQEGLSFIYSSLVKDIKFSGGGFDSQYGDKLSSVLDITYKTPVKFKGSVMASLLGVEAHLENKIGNRITYLVGARYRANGYLLNSLPTKGSYNPVFMDAQFVTNYAINENLTWSVIGHFSSNNYRFSPQTAETDFGLANEAYRFKIYFDGQENTLFQTLTGGTSLKWTPTKKTKLDFYATIFHSDEREYYDIQGQYYLNQLETDPSKDDFGDSIASLGVGTFLNHARNRLNSNIFNIYHNGEHQFFNGYKNDERTRYQNHKLKWGISYQQDQFLDVLSEWKVLDSAGYSLPYVNNPDFELYQTIKSKLNLQNQKSTAFLQMNSIWSKIQLNKFVEITKTTKEKDSIGNKIVTNHYFSDTIKESSSRLALNYGTRFGYTSVNNDFYITPRVSLTYFPRVYMVENNRIVRRDVRYRLSTGLYYQPPIYREFRTAKGELNFDVKSQKSAHFVLGTDVYFNMWGRKSPFKFTAEAYYKHMWDVNPYYIDNVRTIYLANNDAVAYAYGIDLNVNGQFVEGIESFFKVGILSTKENLLTDSYYNYFNTDGEKIIPGVTQNQKIADSSIVYPGYIPRPTDQWVNFGALIQDRMPGHESISVQVGVQYGTGLPYGPPSGKRYQAILRQKSYFRVDIGTSYDLLYKKKDNFKKIREHFTDAIISLEVFNLLGINNILSHQWIQTTDGNMYAVPNYLTQRRFNVKMILRF